MLECFLRTEPNVLVRHLYLNSDRYMFARFFLHSYHPAKKSPIASAAKSWRSM